MEPTLSRETSRGSPWTGGAVCAHSLGSIASCENLSRHASARHEATSCWIGCLPPFLTRGRQGVVGGTLGWMRTHASTIQSRRGPRFHLRNLEH